MLVLSRKKEEVILVGDDIRITVVRISGHQVRIGVDAPRDVAIVREELAVKDVEDLEVEGPAVVSTGIEAG